MQELFSIDSSKQGPRGSYFYTIRKNCDTGGIIEFVVSVNYRINHGLLKRTLGILWCIWIRRFFVERYRRMSIE